MTALLPYPKSLKQFPGTYILPKDISARVQVLRTPKATEHPEGYSLTINRAGITIQYREPAGLRAATATLRQLIREYGRRLPCLKIRDWPDFARRGVMLDISRGRVPRLETLLDFATKLADLKINELQLYTEHTFAYRRYKRIWQSWGALTAKEIRTLDAHCRALGIDLVPNQNSFGHLRYFLEDPRLKKLGELSEPYEADTKDFVRRPTTLAPNHPGTLPFLRGLYNELLPNFSSQYFNVGCDETWDLGKGQSKKLCEKKGKGAVYLDFLKQIHREVSARGKTMMFWGDIILKYPNLIKELATFGAPVSDPARRTNKLQQIESDHGIPNIIALNWGYEANHPFAKESAAFAKAGIPFYVCPGTSTWQTIIGKHDNGFANLKAAAKVGKQFGAIGYLNTDWGDGGHPQPLAVSWPLFAAGAALAWNASSLDDNTLTEVLGRDIYEEPTGKIAKAAMRLGFAHQKLGINAVNETPLGTVIAAPKPEDRELFCRNGLKWFSKIPRKNILAALTEIQKQRAEIQQAFSNTPASHDNGARPETHVAQAFQSAGSGDFPVASSNFTKPRHNKSRNDVTDSALLLAVELDLAARMAEQSCHYMLWQQAVAAGKTSAAKALARDGIRELQQLEKDFNSLRPLRNKGTTKHSTPFLKWRIADYSR